MANARYGALEGIRWQPMAFSRGGPETTEIFLHVMAYWNIESKKEEQRWYSEAI